MRSFLYSSKFILCSSKSTWLLELRFFLTPAAGTCISGTQADHLVAIKLSNQVSACREAALMKTCEGPHVAELLDSFTSASLTCLVMPHYDTTLGHMLLDSSCSFLQIGCSVLHSFIYICWTRACREYDTCSSFVNKQLHDHRYNINYIRYMI